MSDEQSPIDDQIRLHVAANAVAIQKEMNAEGEHVHRRQIEVLELKHRQALEVASLAKGGRQEDYESALAQQMAFANTKTLIERHDAMMFGMKIGIGVGAIAIGVGVGIGYSLLC